MYACHQKPVRIFRRIKRYQMSAIAQFPIIPMSGGSYIYNFYLYFQKGEKFFTQRDGSLWQIRFQASIHADKNRV